ncbi:MAG: VCBS repeat-containing protein [Verrucomicrobiales bacterium]|nr:VCBS repeat-containing protein [Verrucomicrobiales bacterium]
MTHITTKISWLGKAAREAGSTLRGCITVCLLLAILICDSLGAASDKLRLDRWTYVQVDDSRGKWGDLDPPDWLRYFGLSAFDVNGDGYLDIIAGRYFYRSPGGDMTGRWERVEVGRNVDGILFVDVDGDQFADGIAQALPDVYWLEAEDKQGNSWKAVRIATLPKSQHVNGQGFATAQIIPGGRSEIVLSTGSGIYYLKIPADASAENWPATLAAPEASEQGLAVGDIDGDGLIDIAAAHGHRVEPKSAAWWKNPGRQSGPWKRTEVGSTANYSADRVVVTDVNGDGRPEVLITEESWRTHDRVAQLLCFEQRGPREAPLWERRTILTAASLNSLDVADLDRDGDVDIVTGEHKGKDKRVFVLENDGNGRFTEYVIDHGKESHLGTRLFDQDGDGDLDILSVGWDEYRFLHLWRNDAVKPSRPLIRKTPGKVK